jgi:hypothetical protein
MLRCLLPAVVLLLLLTAFGAGPRPAAPRFRVLAFFTARHDAAHISFVREAHRWFAQTAAAERFVYDTTSNWNRLNAAELARYQVVVFLDTRPETPAQRAAFEQYMKGGGAWLGFHFAAFALTPSAYPQNWPWYHDELLGAGEYAGNTWRPTAAVLRVEAPRHPATRHLPRTFTSAPNEWYKWQRDLRQNPDIQILLAVDSASFPLGTGPKAHEIWHSGYYPVAWTNRKYRMLYVNMGHNDLDYEHGTNRDLSLTFANETQSRFIREGLRWLGAGKKR